MAKKLGRLRWSGVIAGAAAIALLATGCSASDSGPSSSGDTADASGSVTIWVGSWWETQVPAITEAFAKDHPEIELTIELLPIDGYLDKFTSSAIGGTPPDIVDLDATWVSTVAAAGLLQPLDDYASDLSAADYAPAIWEASHYQDTLFAYPDRGESEIYYYNKTVFDNAGVPYPTAEWSYDDLKEIAKELTIPDVQSGMGLAADLSDAPNVLSSFAPVLWSFGGDFLNADNTEATMDTPEAIAGITYWTDFYVTDKTAPAGTPNFSTTRDLIPLFQANQLGLMVQASNTFETLSADPALQWGTVPAPDGGTNRGGGWTMGIPVGAANTPAAAVFLNWLSQPDIQGQMVNRMPAVLGARDIAPWNDPKYDMFKQVTPESRSVPSVANWAQMQTVVITELQKILTAQETVEQGAKAMNDQINTILDDAQ